MTARGVVGRHRAGAALLAALAYLPALTSAPGRMPADTKLYLYLDPGRLITDAPWTFDARQFAGWVPHQVVAYLWPQGPWFWVFDRLGVPDWVAHRMWLGTLLFAAGTGAAWCARRLGVGPVAALATGVIYQVTPYVLPYVSRTSAMLLPYAGLGWIVGLTVLAATRRRWRHPALAALVVASVGAVNATALMMVAPAPVLWLATAAAGGVVTWRRAVSTALRIGALSLLVSLWWIAAVVVQGRSGADVLSFSESLSSVSYTSTAPEVWRAMGYWLDYVRDLAGATTTAAADHMTSGRVVVANFLPAIVGLVALAVVRWPHRRFAGLLVAVGVVLGVGVHPIERPSPLMDLVLGDGTSGAALALRSSTRAAPMIVLGVGLLVGAGLEALAGRGWRRPELVRVAGVVATAVVVLVGLPSLTGHRLVDPALARDQDPPAAWREAAAELDRAPRGFRVLQLPGAEFGAFRWGYTVDPPLPGLTDRPLVTRDLLPLGSGPAMDLLYALDDRFQTGTAERASVAPIARLLGADTIWVTGDAAFERFRTPRPELTAAFFAGAGAGLGAPVPFGAPATNEPALPMLDETALADPRVGEPVAPVELVPVEDPEPVIRAGAATVLVTGSGDGLVDAAAAGLVDGHEVVRYTGTLGPDDVGTSVAAATAVVVTDSNRPRAHHWRGSQDVTGFTESAAADQPRFPTDPADVRLAVVPAAAARTTAEQVGPVRAWASSYGEPFAYRPEDRALMAIDGDPATAWRVGDRADPVGATLVLRVEAPIDHLVLRQPDGAAAVRHVASVDVSVGGGPPRRVELGPSSLAGEGQRIDIAAPAGGEVRIRIAAVAVPDPSIGPALAAVGFATVDAGLGPTAETVVVADDLGSRLPADTPLAYVFTRLRTDPANRWRSDPEPVLDRTWAQTGPRVFTPTITVRLDRRAPDADLAELLGITGGVASARLTGMPAAAGWAATDGDPDTAWRPPFGASVGARLDVTLAAPTAAVELRQPAADRSPITGIRVSARGVSVEATVDADGRAVLSSEVPAGPVTIEITAVDPVVVLDRRYSEPVTLPAAISEVVGAVATQIPNQVDTGCRDDLLSLDGDPLAVRVRGEVAALLAGEPIVAEPCDGPTLAVGGGDHRLVSHPGPVAVDRVVLDAGAASAVAAARGEARPVVTVTHRERLHRTVVVDGCPDGCWLVLGEGFRDAWSARADGRDLGPPHLVDGGFNGWWLPGSNGPVTVELGWTAQRPLTLALLASLVGVLACVVLAVADRRRTDDPRPVARPRLVAPTSAPIGWRRGVAATVMWVGLASVLVGWSWAAAALVAGVALLVGARAPRLAALAAAAILGLTTIVIVAVVRSEAPWPDAGWPRRFERLHHLALFAVTAVVVATWGDRQREAASERSPAGRYPHETMTSEAGVVGGTRPEARGGSS